jgi:hypothetical protein
VIIPKHGRPLDQQRWRAARIPARRANGGQVAIVATSPQSALRRPLGEQGVARSRCLEMQSECLGKSANYRGKTSVGSWKDTGSLRSVGIKPEPQRAAITRHTGLQPASWPGADCETGPLSMQGPRLVAASSRPSYICASTKSPKHRCERLAPSNTFAY